MVYRFTTNVLYQREIIINIDMPAIHVVIIVVMSEQLTKTDVST